MSITHLGPLILANKLNPEKSGKRGRKNAQPEEKNRAKLEARKI